MKRLFKLFILASLVIAGCAKISTEDPQEANLQPMTFSAMVSDEPDAKAAIDGLDIKWSVGDEIGVFDGTAVQKFTLKSGAGTTSAVFEGEAAEADSYIAVYPYDENLTVDSEGKIHGLNVPRVQTAGSCPVIMTAECKDGGNAFAFKSALAYVKVTPGFVCHKIVLETYEADSDGCDLCGEVELASGSARVVGNPCSHVMLTGEINANNSYCIGVAPKRLAKGFKVIFDDVMDEAYIPGYGLQYTKKSSKATDLLRGHILNLGEFSKSGTAWTENGVYLASFEMAGQDTEEFDDRAVYDWKDFMRIVSCCDKTGSSKTSRLYFQEDIDFGGRVLLPSVFYIWGGNVHLYGNGHKISNYIQGSMTVGKYGQAGLFAVEELQSFCVDNLSLYPKQFNVSSSDNEIYGGAFAGGIYCTEFIQFKNCSVSGDISVKCTGNQLVCAGGFAGFARARGVESITDDAQPGVYLENCLMEGSVTAYSEDDPAYAGGFLGYVGGTVYDFICYITRCRNRAAVSATGDEDGAMPTRGIEAVSAGGIVGCDRDLSNDVILRLNSCVNDGQVTAEAMDNDNAFAGGMVGCHDSDGSNVTVDVHPYVHNCLNRGVITATSDNGKAGGIAGYCYDEKTTLRNCVDDGKLSGKVCAHISGTKGSYSAVCYWTIEDSLPGIHDKYDHGKYEPGRMSGYKTDLAVTDLHPEEGESGWILRDGRLDLDIIR